MSVLILKTTAAAIALFLALLGYLKETNKPGTSHLKRWSKFALFGILASFLVTVASEVYEYRQRAEEAEAELQADAKRDTAATLRQNQLLAEISRSINALGDDFAVGVNMFLDVRQRSTKPYGTRVADKIGYFAGTDQPKRESAEEHDLWRLANDTVLYVKVAKPDKSLLSFTLQPRLDAEPLNSGGKPDRLVAGP